MPQHNTTDKEYHHNIIDRPTIVATATKPVSHPTLPQSLPGRLSSFPTKSSASTLPMTHFTGHSDGDIARNRIRHDRHGAERAKDPQIILKDTAAIDTTFIATDKLHRNRNNSSIEKLENEESTTNILLNLILGSDDGIEHTKNLINAAFAGDEAGNYLGADLEGRDVIAILDDGFDHEVLFGDEKGGSGIDQLAPSSASPLACLEHDANTDNSFTKSANSSRDNNAESNIANNRKIHTNNIVQYYANDRAMDQAGRNNDNQCSGSANSGKNNDQTPSNNNGSNEKNSYKSNNITTPMGSGNKDENGNNEQGNNNSNNDYNESSSDDDSHASNAQEEKKDNEEEEEEEEEEEKSQLLFSCQCDSARTIATLLSCLKRVITSSHSSSLYSTSSWPNGGTSNSGAAAAAVANSSATNKVQHATVYAGPNGLTFHVQHGLARQSQCSVDMPKGLFREYFVGEEEVWMEDSDDEEEGDDGSLRERQRGGGNKSKEIIQGGEFGINLTTVLECFSILSRNNKSMQSMASAKSAGGGGGGSKQNYSGEYASLDIPLCMSYDRGTALFHLEFLEGGNLPPGPGSGDAAAMGGGVLVTCEVPGVAVSDDVDDGPDAHNFDNNDHSSGYHNNSNSTGLASAFRSSPLLARAILYSDALQAAVAELYDVPGASIVQASFSKQGLELGTVGPRSEVWVSLPYHQNQGGMYVGMECYKPTALEGNVLHEEPRPSPVHVRRYPLGAFLSGMRGLDIGCETCISVNTRGMMAIQHQVTMEGCYDNSFGRGARDDGLGRRSNGSSNLRPSFVDFIMTCIEEEKIDDMEEEENPIEEIADIKQKNNLWSDAQRNVPERHKSDGIRQDGYDPKVRQLRDNGARGRSTHRCDEHSGDEEGVGCRPAKVRKEELHDSVEHGVYHDGGRDFNSDDQHLYEQRTNDDTKNIQADDSNYAAATATNRILGELELDQELISSSRKSIELRKGALEDIRRRREERLRRSLNHSYVRNTEDDKEGEISDHTSGKSNGENYRGRRSIYARKRHRGTADYSIPHKAQRSDKSSSDCSAQSGDDENDNYEERSCDSNCKSQSTLEEDEESEPDDSLDVTAEIPQLFSRWSLMSTLHHSTHHSRGKGKGKENGVRLHVYCLFVRMQMGTNETYKLEFYAKSKCKIESKTMPEWTLACPNCSYNNIWEGENKVSFFYLEINLCQRNCRHKTKIIIYGLMLKKICQKDTNRMEFGKMVMIQR